MILVFGATGYVGRYLCPYLKQQGFDVLALGRSAKAEAFLRSKNIPFQHFDLLDSKSFEQLPHENVEAIVNLATMLPEIEGTPLEAIYNVNVVGAARILEFARENGISKVIMASSHKVSNRIIKPVITEEDICYGGPDTPYIISKLAAENFMKYYHEDFGMDTITLRFTGVHGYGELMGQLHPDGSYSMSAFERFVGLALKGEKIEIWGDQSIRRDHVYIKDVLRAIEAAIRAVHVSGICTIASGVGYSQYEEALAIAEIFAADKVSEVVCCPEKPGLTRGYVYDISKARELLGWEPVYNTPHKYLEDYRKEWLSGEYHHFHRIREEDRPATYGAGL